jgi:hypothetical protein
MYAVVFKSSGIVAYRNSDRTQCKLWALWNDHLDVNGEPMGLFQVIKTTHATQ